MSIEKVSLIHDEAPESGDWVLVHNPYDGSYSFDQTEKIETNEDNHLVFYGKSGTVCLAHDVTKVVVEVEKQVGNVRKFNYLTIDVDGANLHISMDYKQHLHANEDDILDNSKGYYQSMFELFEDAHVGGDFHWWDGNNPSLGLTEAPYISTEQTYCEDTDMFLPAGDIYYFPNYTTHSEVQMLKQGDIVTYVKSEE